MSTPIEHDSPSAQPAPATPRGCHRTFPGFLSIQEAIAPSGRSLLPFTSRSLPVSQPGRGRVPPGATGIRHVLPGRRGKPPPSRAASLAKRFRLAKLWTYRPGDRQTARAGIAPAAASGPTKARREGRAQSREDRQWGPAACARSAPSPAALLDECRPRKHCQHQWVTLGALGDWNHKGIPVLLYG
jgi:hypothetical protein